MIKKYILGLFVLFVGVFSFVNASVDGHVVSIGSQVSSEYNSSYNMFVNGQGLFLTSYLGEGKQILMSNIGRYFFFLNDGTPYIGNSTQSDGSWHEEGVPGNFLVCDSLSSSDVSPSNCQNFAYTSNSGYVTTIFKNMDKWYYGTFIESALGGWIGNLMCFSSDSIGNSVCFYSCSHPNCGGGQSDTIGGVSVIQNLSNSQNFGISFSDIPQNLLGTYPGYNFSSDLPGGQLDGGGISPSSDYSAINYFEKTYGWDRSICYAGVDNLSYLYGQNGVSFSKGHGLSIFDVFEQLYGNRDLDKVYVWLNVQLFNYENWFNIPGNNIGGVGSPSWLGNYNSGTNQIDLYYDNLTFPFFDKPAAFYFLADNIESQSPYFTMGSEVVSYCNIKINSGTFDEIIDQAVKNNINNYTEQFNTNQALNPDGTQKDYTGYWVGSGVDLAFSGNVSIKNTLKNFFDEFDKGLSVVDINTNNRILPSWIVTAFIFVVLFKFLRKR